MIKTTALSTLISMNADEKFGKCKEIAIAVSNEIPESVVIFGLYFPITPKHKWDERWRTSEFFTHFWVQVDGRIIDAAKEQYGEPFVSIIPIDDVRYVKIGVLDNDDDKVIPLVNEPKIDWSTVALAPLKPTKVVWAGYDERIKIINQLRAS